MSTDLITQAREKNQAITVFPDGYISITQLDDAEERAKDKAEDEQFMFGMKRGRE